MSVLQRITARVFASAAGGGNPVTIFQTSIPISPSIKSKLAQSCEWESVVISPGDALTFFMPSGDEVSFCAHAAMGAACVLSEISGDSDTIKFNTYIWKTSVFFISPTLLVKILRSLKNQESCFVLAAKVNLCINHNISKFSLCYCVGIFLPIVILDQSYIWSKLHLWKSVDQINPKCKWRNKCKW